MKKMKIFLLSFILCISAQLINAQLIEGMKVNIDVNVDPLGDANIKMEMKFNAQLWDEYKRSGSDNAAVLKQQTIRSFPKFVVEDFDVKFNEMDRMATLTYKVPGLASQNEKGKWQSSFDSKDPDVTKLSDRNFLLVDPETHQSLKINLPENAKNAKIDKDSFGNAVLSYDANVPGGAFSNIIKYLGFLLIGVGIFLLYKNLSAGKTQATTLRKVVPLHDNEAAAEIQRNKIV